MASSLLHRARRRRPKSSTMPSPAITRFARRIPIGSNRSACLRVLAVRFKVSGRQAEAEAIYQQVLEQATDHGPLLNAVHLASQLGQTDGLIETIDRLLQSIPPSAHSGVARISRSQVWLQAASVLGGRNDYSGMQAAVGRALAARAAEFSEHPARRRTTATSAPPGLTPVYTASGQVVYLSSGAATGSASSGFPRPNAVFDQTLLTQMQMLVNARGATDPWSSVIRSNSSSNLTTRIPSAELKALIAFLEDQAAGAAGETQTVYQLAATYFRWWSGETAAALASLQQAVKWAPQDADLSLQLAELLLERGQAADALAAADAVEPTDADLLRDREQFALKAAMKLDLPDRAKQAAERLAGLALDGQAQLQLAEQMQRLGMAEQAEQVLDRLRRRSGNDVATLASLMQKYQSHGKTEFAVQLAQQILRRSTPATNQPTARAKAEVTARRQALQVLKASGELPQIIARLEAQLARSPKSNALRQQIAEYRSGGAAVPATTRIAPPAFAPPRVGALTAPTPVPATAPTRTSYTMAAEAARSGKLATACEFYANAVEENPQGLHGQFVEVRKTFQQAGRLKNFVDLFLKVDLQPFSVYSQRLADVANEATLSSEARSAGLALLRRLSETFPESRAQLLASIRNEDLWQSGALYPFVREAMIPQPGQRVLAWQGLGDVWDYRSDGRAVSLLSRWVQLARSPELREQVRLDVQVAVTGAPHWQAGTALLAILEAHAGDTAAARKRIDKLLADAAIPPRAAHLLAQELSDDPMLARQSIQLFEVALRIDAGNPHDYPLHPGRQLAQLYGQTGQRPKARALIHDLLRKQDYGRHGALVPGYREGQEMQALHAAARDFVKLEMPGEALQLCHRALSDPKRLVAASRWIGRDLRPEWRQTQSAAQRSVAAQPLSIALADWIQPSTTAVGQALTPPSSSTVQFALSVQPRHSTSGAMVSIFETVLDAAGGKPFTWPSDDETESPPSLTLQDLFEEHFRQDQPVSALALDGVRQPAVFAQLRHQLAAADSDDLSVRIALALVELIDPGPDQPAATVAAVQRVVDAATTATDRSSSDAVVAVWLVARRALRHVSPEVQKLGGTLAECAMSAARGHDERRWRLAILRERGQIEYDLGDLRSAERYWTELLSALSAGPTADRSDNNVRSQPTSVAPVVAP